MMRFLEKNFQQHIDRLVVADLPGLPCEGLDIALRFGLFRPFLLNISNR